MTCQCTDLKCNLQFDLDPVDQRYVRNQYGNNANFIHPQCAAAASGGKLLETLKNGVEVRR